MLWLKLTDNKTKTICLYVIFTCHLKPLTTGKMLKSSSMISDIYKPQDQGTLQIYGDSNARIGECVDYIEGVADNVKSRKTIYFCTNTRPLYYY